VVIDGDTGKPAQYLGRVRRSEAVQGDVRLCEGVLEDRKAPYNAYSYDPPFLQGSYGNDTNVFRDSDVDVVMKLDTIYHRDISRLSADDLMLYNKLTGGAVPYNLHDFKRDVAAWLTKNYGSAVKSGKKAIFIKGENSRRDVDVLVSAAFRRYYSYKPGNPNDFIEGVCFFLPDNTLVENYPKRHSANCTQKMDDTKQWFKPTVRVFKNMRNRMIERRELKERIAPSYHLEGMLYNVPSEHFGKSYQDTFVNCFNWILNAEASELVCASRMEWLVRDGSPTAWPVANFNTYLNAAAEHWKKG
jgi:hypothetical protein